MRTAESRRSGWIVLVAFAMAPPALGTENAYVNEFDTPTPSWNLSNPASTGQIVRQERLTNPASEEGATIERLVVVCPPGQSLVLTQPIDATAVIDETRIVLRVRSNRPGVTVAAQVALPRNQSLDRGQSPTLLARGGSYEPRGGWQELEIRDLPRLVTRQARVLRTSAGPQIDEREAYVDQVVLIVPGGPGSTEVVIDRLVVEGIAAQKFSPGKSATLAEGPVFPNAELSSAATASSVPVQSVRLVGAQLTIDDRAIFPRIVQHNGEDLELLARCGFNGVWLRASPTSEQLAEARKLGIGLIAVPPSHPIPAEEASAWNALLAWDLGDRLALAQIDAVTAQAQTLRRQDSELRRPLIAAPSDSLEQYNRVASILLLNRRASLHDTHLTAWPKALAKTMRTARLGTPLWVRIDLDHSEEVVRQLQILAPQEARVWQTPERLARQIHSALGCQASGFVFASSRQLSSSDTANQITLAACELLNRELRLIEPWLVSAAAAGVVICTDPGRRAVVMQRDRARLVALRRLPGRTESYDPTGAPSPHSITVPGVPESAGAYVLTPGGMRRVAQNRVSGGVRVSLAEVPLGAYLVLTDDAAAVTALMRGAAQGSRRAAQLARFLALEELRQTEQITAQLQQMPAATSFAQRRLSAAKAAIGEADLALASGNSESAYRQLLVARDQFATLEAHLVTQPSTTPELASNPLAGSLARLLDQWKLDWALASLPPGDNLLYGGDCEELQQMKSYGWTHIRYPLPGIDTTVELTAEKPQQGARALRLVAAPVANSPTAATIDAAAVWVATPEVQLAAAQTVEIAGWVWVRPAHSSHLTITDSLGGDELALDVGQTPDWQPFRMIRTAAEPSALQVKFALFGVGEARVDGVMIRPVLPARGQSPRRLPAVPVRNVP